MPITKTCEMKTPYFQLPGFELSPLKRFPRLLLLLFFSVSYFISYSQKPSPIKLKSGHRFAETNFQSEKAKGILKKSLWKERVYTIVQFDKIPDAGHINKLSQAGIRLLQYIPDNAYWVSFPEKINVQQFSSLSVKGVYELRADEKLSSSLYNQWQKDLGEKRLNYISVNIVCLDAGTNEELKTKLRESGAIILDAKFEKLRIFQAKVSTESLEAIASLPFVSYINKGAADKPLNYISHQTHNIYALTSNLGAGRNLKGTGIMFGLGDEGNATGHIDLIDRIINRAGAPYANHATNVVGAITGAGILYERNKGVAVKSSVVGQVFSNIITTSPTYVADYGMVITNNSYFTGEDSCAGNSDYNELSNYLDEQMRNYDELLHVFAAGNDGYFTCSPYSRSFATIKSGWQCAKNVLDVGVGIGEWYVRDFYSSKGPTDDGRLKPEIMASGSGVWTTFPVNYYSQQWGTSMAAPVVAGVAGLLYERYRQLNGNANPKSALIKALLCNSADEIGNPGPDFSYGFGWMNAEKAVQDLETGNYFISSVSTGGSNNHNINVPNNTAELKVMLYWNDAPAIPLAASTLINDLDLTVKKGGIDYFPWILNPAPAGVNTNATTGIDHTNNIEQVTISNPAQGNYTINITGFSVPQGPQEYVVVYETVPKGIELSYPNGGEMFLADTTTEYIMWRAYDGNSNPFTLEYTLDNGSNWNLINNNVSATSKIYAWNVAALGAATNLAKVRITRNTTAYTDQSDNTFTILGKPSSLTPSILCDGYIQLSWPAVTSATDYEIFMKQGVEMVSIGTTATTTFDVDGLKSNQQYWFGVAARINGTRSKRSVARFVTPSSGVCTLPNFDNDLKLSSVVTPSTGRKFTSTSLTATQAVTVAIKNLDNAATTGSYNISYRINGGPIVTETSSALINAQATVNYTFTATYGFSAEGTYNIEAWVKQTGDTRTYNDTAVKTVKQLFNDAVTLPFTEGFETATDATYFANTTGFTGVDRCDFTGNNTNSRGRTFVNSNFPRTGTRSVTIDATTNFLVTTQSNLITTVNLANYSAAQGLRLSLYYRDHQQNGGANNYVWIRGSDTSPWVQAYNLNQTDVTDGSYITVRNIDINQLLTNAGQPISSSFQIKIGQQGITSANDASFQPGNNDNNDGYTIDDIAIVQANDDLELLSITNPGKQNCGLTNATVISVNVKNTSASTFTNVPVSYRINGGAIITETMASVPANTTTPYSFTTTADFSVPGSYTLDVWVKNSTDNYAVNDSIVNYPVYNNFTVTSFPYLEGFENNNGGWYTLPPNSSWEWGTPAGTIINRAANGTKAWVTNLDGDYKDNEVSYLYSPCFDLSTLTQPVISFSHIYRTEDNCACDYHWLEYSTDGTNWQKLGVADGNGTNWFDDQLTDTWQISRTHWLVSSRDIPTNSSSVRFRFVFSSDPFVNYEGVGIDDIHIFDKARIYDAGDITVGFSQTVSGNNWVHFDMGGERVVSIHPNGQNLGNTEVKMYINPGSVRNSNNQYYHDRNIVIQPANAPAGNVKLRFYFTEQETQFLLDASDCPTCSKPKDAYGLGVTKYTNAAEENGTLADNSMPANYLFIPPSAVDIIPYDNGYYAEYNVNSFSEFWLNDGGPGGKPLPVKLISFTAQKQNKNAVLTWVTASEISIEKYVVERKTNAGFIPIGEVLANGSSNTTTTYTLTDINTAKGNNYYRVRIVEKAGTPSYSETRKLNFDVKVNLSIYPNPVTEGNVTIVSDEVIDKIVITTSKGEMIAQLAVNNRLYSIPVKKWAKGIYWIKVFTKTETVTEKLIKL